jgi:hypothetical protein
MAEKVSKDQGQLFPVALNLKPPGGGVLQGGLSSTLPARLSLSSDSKKSH